MDVPVGGRTGQLLCGDIIAASRQCQIWLRECCGTVALGDEKQWLPINVKNCF
jgi:hypothetical protein